MVQYHSGRSRRLFSFCFFSAPVALWALAQSRRRSPIATIYSYQAVSTMDDIKPAAVAKLDDNTVLSRKTKKIPKKSGGGGKRKAATAALSPADLIAILPWIPRAQLEDLICSSINNNTVMTSQQLINAIPDNQKWRFNEHTGRKKKSYTPVKSGPERVDTGSFDSVDTSTMLNILTYLNCRERYVCVTEVCKGWREFKSSMPSLFLDLR